MRKNWFDGVPEDKVKNLWRHLRFSPASQHNLANTLTKYITKTQLFGEMNLKADNGLKPFASYIVDETCKHLSCNYAGVLVKVLGISDCKVEVKIDEVQVKKTVSESGVVLGFMLGGFRLDTPAGSHYKHQAVTSKLKVSGSGSLTETVTKTLVTHLVTLVYGFYFTLLHTELLRFYTHNKDFEVLYTPDVKGGLSVSIPNYVAFSTPVQFPFTTLTAKNKELRDKELLEVENLVRVINRKTSFDGLLRYIGKERLLNGHDGTTLVKDGDKADYKKKDIVFEAKGNIFYATKTKTTHKGGGIIWKPYKVVNLKEGTVFTINHPAPVWVEAVKGQFKIMSFY